MKHAFQFRALDGLLGIADDPTLALSFQTIDAASGLSLGALQNTQHAAGGIIDGRGKDFTGANLAGTHTHLGAPDPLYHVQKEFASNWHQLFADTPEDERNKLTWKNIFAKPEVLEVAYNFYSPSDEVVENADDSEEFGHPNNIWAAANAGRHAWVQNEMAKGGQNIITPAGFHDINGGWGFNGAWEIFEPTGNAGYHRTRTPSQVISITDEQLKTDPFHRHFLYQSLYDPAQGSATAGVVRNRYRLLGTGIPATSYAIAANSCPELSRVNNDDKRNFNMPLELRSSGGYSSWPAHEKAEEPEDWMHSDFKDVAFHFLHPMYQKIIDLAELDRN